MANQAYKGLLNFIDITPAVTHIEAATPAASNIARLTTGPGIDLIMPVNWQDPLNKGLVAWWMVIPGNDGGSVWRNLTKTRPHFDGILTNANPVTVWKGTNRPGGYGELNLDDNNNDVVIVDTSVKGHPLDGASEFTLAAWVKIRHTDNDQEIMWRGSSDFGQGAGGFIFHFDDVNGESGQSNVWAFLIRDSVTTINTHTAPNSAVINEWVHISSVVKTDVPGKIYINGKDATNFTSATPWRDATLPAVAFDMTIGSVTDDHTARHFDGQLDDLRMWTRALSDREILEIYQDSKGG